MRRGGGVSDERQKIKTAQNDDSFKDYTYGSGVTVEINLVSFQSVSLSRRKKRNEITQRVMVKKTNINFFK